MVSNNQAEEAAMSDMVHAPDGYKTRSYRKDGQDYREKEGMLSSNQTVTPNGIASRHVPFTSYFSSLRMSVGFLTSG